MEPSEMKDRNPESVVRSGVAGQARNLFALVVFGCAIWLVTSLRQRTAVLEARLASKEVLETLVGQPLPEVEYQAVSGGKVGLAKAGVDRPAIVWVVSPSDCLICEAELAKLASLAKTHPTLETFVLLEGQQPSFPVLDWPASTVLGYGPETTGLTSRSTPGLRTPLRLLLVRGTVMMASQGPELSNVDFLDRVDGLLFNER